MPKHVREIRIFVASPGDTEVERAELERVVGDLDRTLGERDGLHLKLVRWEKDARPGAGAPQEVINRQISPADCDIFIGIMWSHFGTPTRAGYASGTEEEFRIARRAGRPVLFYFCEKDPPIKTREDHDQYGKVLTFREELEKENLTWTYPSPEKFADTVREHLSKEVGELIHRPPAEARRFRAYLADVPENLGFLRRALANKMEQAGIEVLESAVPGEPAPSGGERPVARANVSIHLLAGSASTEVRKQLEEAVAGAPHTLIWVRKEWPFAEFQDDPLARYLVGLENRTSSRNYEIIRESREVAVREILARLRGLQDQWEHEDARAVLINANKMDAESADSLVSQLEGHEIEIARFDAPSSGLPKPSWAPDADFEDKLRRSRALVFVFGSFQFASLVDLIGQTVVSVFGRRLSIPLWAIYATPPPKGPERDLLNRRFAPLQFVWVDSSGNGAVPQGETVQGLIQRLSAERAS